MNAPLFALRSNDLLGGAWEIRYMETLHISVQEQASSESEQDAFVESLVAQRRELLKSRQFIKAAVIQENLRRLGVELSDTTDGTRWYRD